MNTYLLTLLAALIPMIVGAIWYSPAFLGNAWMKSADMTEEKIKGANMAIIFGVTFVFSILLAMMIQFIVIHQRHIDSIFFNDLMNKNQETMDFVKQIHERGDANHRTFGHGLLHGIIAGILFALPVLGTNALFERKGFKYIAINAGYWIVCIGLMGGFICQFAK